MARYCHRRCTQIQLHKHTQRVRERESSRSEHLHISEQYLQVGWFVSLGVVYFGLKPIAAVVVVVLFGFNGVVRIKYGHVICVPVFVCACAPVRGRLCVCVCLM